MSLSRWKVLACTLTIGVGGLAVFATPPSDKKDAPKEPAPLPNLSVKPSTPANGDDTPSPVKPAKAEQFDLDIPAVPTVSKTPEPTKKPASEPVFEPVSPPPAAPVIIPVKGEADVKPTEKVPDLVIVPPPPSAGSKKDSPAPPVIKVPEVKPPTAPAPLLELDVPSPASKAPPVAVETPPSGPLPVGNLETLPPAVGPSKPMPPPLPSKQDQAPPPPPMKPETKPPVDLLIPNAPAAQPPKIESPIPPVSSTPSAGIPSTPSTPSKVTESVRLKMLLRMGDGQPRFEIRNAVTSQLLLKVYGEKIEMASPTDARSSLAGVTAIGRVRFVAHGIEGTCDHLTILSGTGEVLMKGNIRLKSKHGKSWSEMTAEKMVYQIGSSGLASSGGSTPHVRPASYIPD